MTHKNGKGCPECARLRAIMAKGGLARVPKGFARSPEGQAKAQATRRRKAQERKGGAE
jgi:hypothetical protein